MTAEPVEDVWSRTRGRDWTWADLQEIPDDGPRYEIIDGSLYVSPGPSRPHQIAASRWRVELEGPDAPAVVVHERAEGVSRDVRTVRGGEAAVVDVPFRVELRPAELAGPRARS